MVLKAHALRTDRTPWDERQDRDDRMDCAESSDPTLSHDPAEKTERAEPIDPAEMMLPIDPAGRGEPMDSMDSTDLTEPIERAQSFDHRDSSEDGDFRCEGGADSFPMSASSPAVTASPRAAAAMCGNGRGIPPVARSLPLGLRVPVRQVHPCGSRPPEQSLGVGVGIGEGTSGGSSPPRCIGRPRGSGVRGDHGCGEDEDRHGEERGPAGRDADVIADRQ
jgi:hypothetical protein